MYNIKPINCINVIPINPIINPVPFQLFSPFLSVPPLENFVMNRVLGDYFEILMYKIFVSIDEHTTIGEVLYNMIVVLVTLICRKMCGTWNDLAEY